MNVRINYNSLGELVLENVWYCVCTCVLFKFEFFFLLKLSAVYTFWIVLMC